MSRIGITAVPFVVARDQIPARSTAEDDGVKVRSFHAHELMAGVISSNAELSWLEARAGQDVAMRSHSSPMLLVVMRGRATLVGRTEREVEQGDVVTLPRDQRYGFASVEADLHVLQVKLGSDAPSEHQEEALTLERLTARNAQRARQVLETPFFRLLQTGALDTNHKRAMTCEAIRVFSDAFQTFLFTRQAMCREEDYRALFHGHLLEEIGHNEMLQVSGNRRIAGDAILRATSSWFSHQMLIQDNAGKAVLNLVLETSGFHFHSLAESVFATDRNAKYFAVHSEADEQHMDLGVHLLKDQHPDTYRRLLGVLEDGWDMMETVTTRFAELIDIETKSS